MVVGVKLCELTDGFLWFVCGLYVGILTSPLIFVIFSYPPDLFPWFQPASQLWNPEQRAQCYRVESHRDSEFITRTSTFYRHKVCSHWLIQIT